MSSTTDLFANGKQSSLSADKLTQICFIHNNFSSSFPNVSDPHVDCNMLYCSYQSSFSMFIGVSLRSPKSHQKLVSCLEWYIGTPYMAGHPYQRTLIKIWKAFPCLTRHQTRWQAKQQH